MRKFLKVVYILLTLVGIIIIVASAYGLYLANKDGGNYYEGAFVQFEPRCYGVIEKLEQPDRGFICSDCGLLRHCDGVVVPGEIDALWTAVYLLLPPGLVLIIIFKIVMFLRKRRNLSGSNSSETP